MESSSDEFLCGECEDKFDNLTQFLLHKVQHIEAGKAGGCPLCGMAFSRQVSLREHLHRKHSVAHLKTSQAAGGKRRGRPRKEDPTDELNHIDAVSQSKGDGGGNAVVDTAVQDLISSGGTADPRQQTMHIIIDKVRESQPSSRDVSGVVVETDSSGVFLPPPAVTTVMVKAEDHPPDLVDHVTSEGRSSPCAEPPQPAQSEGSGDDRRTQHECASREVLELEGEATADGCSATEPNATSVGVAGTDSPALPQGRSVKTADALKHEPDPDFLFVLLTNCVKKKSLSYVKQSFKCFHCDYKTSWRRALGKHMAESHADSLAIHHCITIHKSEKLHDQQVMKMSDYAEVLSQQRRQGNSRRIRGVEKQDLSGHYPCAKCDKVFGRLRYLRKHQVIHKAEKRYLCDDCGKAFKTKAYLSAHRATHQPKTYQCTQCEFSSSVNALIHTHRQLHNHHSVICEVCGSAYNDRATLRKHKQVHDATRPYPCAYPGCTWRFRTEVMCRAHLRGHTTAGRFHCHVCHYVFRHKHHLQRHLAAIHGLDRASVALVTGGNKAGGGSSASGARHLREEEVEVCPGKDLMQVVQEEQPPLSDTVNLIVNSGLSSEQLQSVLESGQFVIATDDSDGYEVANITMNVTYDEGLGAQVQEVAEGQTILIPHHAECSQIIFQHEAEPVPASVET